LGSGTALALVAATLPASAGDIDDMRAQIQALQDKIAKIEAQEQRRVAPAAAVEAGSKPKSWKLPGTNTSMNIGGFAILQFDYDIDGNISYLPAGSSPLDNTPGARRQGVFNLTAQQSRVFLATSTPTDWGDLQTMIEFDMNGSGGDRFAPGSLSASEYNSGQGAALRMRKAYGQLGPVLAGQDTTTFFTPGAGERTDVATPWMGSSAFRLGQVRYTHAFGGGSMLQVAIEDNIGFNETLAVSPGLVGARTAAAGNTSGTPALAGGISSANNINQTPAFVGQISHAWSSGSAGLSLMGRRIAVDNGGAAGVGGALHDSATSWGLSLGSGWIISKQFRVGAQFLYGEGLGVYSGGNYLMATGQGGAVPGTFQIDTVNTIGGSAFIQWRFTDTMRANVLYGREQYGYDIPKIAIPAAGTAIGNSVTQYFQQFGANIMWEPVPAVNIGLQYIYAFAGVYNGSNAHQNRLELAFRYSF
jgi:hypothetical protein